MEYNALTEKHFFNSEHVGVIDDIGMNVFKSNVGSKVAGNAVSIHIAITPQNSIKKAVFKAYGNVYTIACASLACSLLENQSVEKAIQINYLTYVKLLDIPHNKLSSAIIVDSAIKNILKEVEVSENYEKC